MRRTGQQSLRQLLGTVLFHSLFRLDFRLIVLYVAKIAAVFLVFRFISHVLFVLTVLAMLRHTKHQSFRMLLEFLPGVFSPSALIVLAYIWSIIHYLLK